MSRSVSRVLFFY